MADKLKAGGLGDPDDAGIPVEFSGSMAQAMEAALNSLLIGEGREPLDTSNTTEVRDRRMLFAAIAQGVVNHLFVNNEAFVVTNESDEPVSRRIRIQKE